MTAKKRKTRRRSISAKSPPDPVTGYANKVLAGRIVAGKLVKLACRRHLRDLKEGPKRGLFWDLEAALWTINFFPDALRLHEGDFSGQPFHLELWQQFIIGSLFGWKKKSGHRRFRTAYVEVGKGNGKSPMAGGIGLYMTGSDGEPGAECYAAAVKRDQADILFQDAVHMVQTSPILSQQFQLSGKRKVYNIAHPSSGSFFRPVSSERRGLDGKRVHCAAVDELHEHPTPMVVGKMRDGTKARKQPLIFEITNSGYDQTSICWEHHHTSVQILEGERENDEWFAYVCQLDKDADGVRDDWSDPKNWPKTNPNLGVSITEEYLRLQVKEAQEIPSSQNRIKRLNFCIWTEQSERWLDMDAWRTCGDPVDAKALEGQGCFGGLDLSSKIDLTAFTLVFPGDPVKVLSWFWLPEEAVRKQHERNQIPYPQWRDQGHLLVTPGNVVDYDAIRTKIKEIGEKYRIQEIGFDPYNATQLSTQLEGDGFKMIEVRQGVQTMSDPSKELEGLVVGRGIAHGNHPILNWCASNVVVRRDHNDNYKPDKDRATGKIDGIVALIMALSRMIVSDGEASVYDERGIQTF
jgi:phage terminase large subunit-like protein